MDTLESLRRKIKSAGELNSVVRAMKGIAASNIGQYEIASLALIDYYRSLELGMITYLQQAVALQIIATPILPKEKSICAIVFGSDQGLVGQFNELISNHTIQALQKLYGNREVWTIGERVQLRFSESKFKNTKKFSTPNSVNAVTSLVSKILIEIEDSREKNAIEEFYIFYNRKKINSGYESFGLRLLPMDNQWQTDLASQKWPTNKIPQVIGIVETTLKALLKEYLFITIYRACVSSLTCENASRLEAMQRAEKNIEDLNVELKNKYHRLRQSTIDEELFDVISGFDANLQRNAKLF